MFESDDFDQILSQFDLPEVVTKTLTKDADKTNIRQELPVEGKELNKLSSTLLHGNEKNFENQSENINKLIQPITDNSKIIAKKDNVTSPKHTKRKIINSYFDYKSKRKFPGPAGLLSGTLEVTNDETICHMELLSQDIEFSQHNSHRDFFESHIWRRLLEDVNNWNLNKIDTVNTIKQQALAGNLRRRKADTVTAFVETIDRSVTDPLITLRDSTGNIKCTLHRDAWSTFSPYIVSEYCALVLWKPTVLTTGSAFKKHYLNITLSNIYAIYSSAVFNEEDKPLPEGYVRICEDNMTLIKYENGPQTIEPHLGPNNESGDTSDLLDGLDSIFSDDLF